MNQRACPVCECTASRLPLKEDACRYVCRKCGQFEVNGLDECTFFPALSPHERPRLSHQIRKMQREGKFPVVTKELAEKLVAHPLPSVREQEDSLIEAVGDALREVNPVARWNLSAEQVEGLIATIGAYDLDSLAKIATFLQGEQLLDYSFGQGISTGSATFQLTPSGWDRYEELKRKPSEAHLAFMAMPFKDSKLDKVFESCFKPAVKQTGFDLRRVDSAPRAGLIDDNLRVEIRRATFVVAELTGNNQGVYWEAGFAEGLGRPVIYTCEKAQFDSEKEKPHFDTNHHVTVVWEESKLDHAARDLKAIIRATLPAEAKQEDE